jgi:uncharacterized cupin superfamily protein
MPSVSAEELRMRLVRNFNDLPQHGERFAKGSLYESFFWSMSGGTAAKKMGISVDIVPPGKRACPYHLHHAQEEMFIVLEGSGTLRVAGELLPISSGDVVVIPAGPEYPHHIINTSDAPLKYLSLSTQERPELCEYPDSGKSHAYAESGHHLLNRSATNADYWDGEPMDA